MFDTSGACNSCILAAETSISTTLGWREAGDVSSLSTSEGAADGGGGGKGDRGSQSIAARGGMQAKLGDEASSIAARGGMQAKLGDEASYRMSAGEGRRVGHLLYAFYMYVYVGMSEYVYVYVGMSEFMCMFMWV